MLGLLRPDLVAAHVECFFVVAKADEVPRPARFGNEAVGGALVRLTVKGRLTFAPEPPRKGGKR